MESIDGKCHVVINLRYTVRRYFRKHIQLYTSFKIALIDEFKILIWVLKSDLNSCEALIVTTIVVSIVLYAIRIVRYV
mgnify:CR=1 FL=1